MLLAATLLGARCTAAAVLRCCYCLVHAVPLSPLQGGRTGTRQPLLARHWLHPPAAATPPGPLGTVAAGCSCLLLAAPACCCCCVAPAARRCLCLAWPGIGIAMATALSNLAPPPHSHHFTLGPHLTLSPLPSQEKKENTQVRLCFFLSGRFIT